MNRQAQKQNNRQQNSSNNSSGDRKWFLTDEAKKFILPQEITNINLYLSQNRYCYEIKEKKNNKSRPLLLDLLHKGSCSSADLHFKSLLNDLVERNEMLAASFPRHGRYDGNFPGRIMLGEGGSTPYSNIVLLKLHPLYGAPFVPASTIKGVLRSCWNALYAEAEEAGSDHTKTEDLLFGTAEDYQQEGNLICFDAFPEEFTLTLDVETPHYSNYYSDGKPPTDDQNPTPISIICMEAVKLPIYLVCKDADLWESQKEKIRKAMKQMIEVYGIGAKTALGYGVGELHKA